MANFDDEDELEAEVPEDQEEQAPEPKELEAEEPPSHKEPQDMESEDLGELPKKQGDEEDKDADDEVGDNEEFAKMLQGLHGDEEPSAEPKAEGDDLEQEFDKIKAPSPVDKYKKYLEDYKKLQDSRRSDLRMNGILQGINQMAQGYAARKVPGYKVDNSAIARIGEQSANRPVEDFEQGQIVQGRQLGLQSDMAAHDPTSPQSTMVRNYLGQKLGMKLPDDVSAADAMMLMKTMGKPQQTKFAQLPVTNQQTGEKTMAVFNPTTGTFASVDGKPMGPEWVRDYRAQSFVDPRTGERSGFSGGTGKVTGPLTGPGVSTPMAPAPEAGQSAELNRTMLTAQQSKQLDHNRDKFVAEVKNDRAAVNSADRVMQVLQNGGDLGDLPAEEQDQMSRAFGQTGHITDSQMGRVLGRSDWRSRMENALSLGFQGKLTDENRQFLMDVMKTIKEQNQNFITNKAKVYSANMANDFKSAPNLKQYNVTPESINKLLSVEQAASSSQGAPKMLREKKSGKVVPIKADKYDAAVKSGLFDKVE